MQERRLATPPRQIQHSAETSDDLQAVAPQTAQTTLLLLNNGKYCARRKH